MIKYIGKVKQEFARSYHRGQLKGKKKLLELILKTRYHISFFQSRNRIKVVNHAKIFAAEIIKCYFK